MRSISGYSTSGVLDLHHTASVQQQNSTVSAKPSSDAASSSEPQSGVTFYTDKLYSTAKPNSLRGAKFLALHEALLTLSHLPEDHVYHLDAAAAARASDYLGLISKNLEIDPPRFFPQDREAAVLTWDIGSVKRLFTIDADDIDLMDVNTRSRVRCDYSFPEDEKERLAILLHELGGEHMISSGASTDGDA